MKKILIAFLLVLGTTAGFAQSKKSTATKTKTKTKTTATAAKKPNKEEVAAAKAAREKMVTEKAQGLTENMSKHLNLSFDQQQKVKKINEKSIREVELARVRYKKNLKKMNIEIQNIGSSRMSLLKDVLSAAQFQAYNQKRAEKMGIQDEGEAPKSPVMQGGFDQ
jgi:hypothetical protein